MRRTTTLDGLHPRGPQGPDELRLAARDLRTSRDGEAVELGRVAVRMLVDRERGVLAVESDPAEPRLSDLVGANPHLGWRRAVDELLPDHRDRRSLLYLVLDGLPAWMALSSFGLVDMAGLDGAPLAPRPGPPFDVASRADLCAGWQRGGALLQLMSAGHSGADFVRPPAPPVEVPDDPLAWHPVEPLAAYGSRRRRRIDIVGGDPLRIDGMFRDTSADGEGIEGVLHEYTVSAAVEPGTLRVVDSAAVPRSLPYEECPQAAVSAARLIGEDVREMRQFVRSELRGPTTCTHLNELYRTFADIGELAALL